MDTSTKDSSWVNLNGLLIQWGDGDGGSYNSPRTITFPKPFSTYVRVAAVSANAAAHYFNGVYLKGSPNTTSFNGFPSFFYNKAQNEIYMKQFNNVSGGAIFQTYKLQMAENPAKPVDPYEAQFRAINDKIDGLYSLLKPNDTERFIPKKKKGDDINE